MNSHQTRYALARAQYETILAQARAAYPAEPSPNASEAAWDAFFDAQEDVDVGTGLNAARDALFEAEQALIAWGATTPAGKQSGLDFQEASTWPSIRERLIDICFRAA
jgi:hypothetical protein